MNPEKSPLVNKLILVVLSFILGCLVLLVIRAYEHAPSSAQLDGTAVEEPQVEEAPAPPAIDVTLPPQRPVMRRPPVTIPPRVVAATPPSLESPAAGPAAAEPVELPVVVPNVNLANVYVGRTSSGGGGAPPRAGSTEIFGTVSLKGTPPREVPIDLGPNCGRLRPDPVTTRHYVVNSEGRLANVFVYLSQGVSGHHAPVVPTVLLDQVGCLFEPYVLGVQTNQKLLARNFDPEMHNLHLVPRLNQESNRAQPAGAPPIEFSFPKPELFMRFKCDVHPWMFAYVSVVDHPFFAVTDTNGLFRLPPSLPAGKYVLTAVHQKAGSLSQEITIGHGEQPALDFQLYVPSIATPQSRVSRRE